MFAGEEDESLGKYIPGHNKIRLSDLHSIFKSGTQNRALEAFSMVRRAQCVLFTSFYELEAQVIDALRENLRCPVYAVGPSIPYTMLDEKPTTSPDGSINDHLQWLDSQPKQSVLYVSLGSFLSVSGTQMDEIAMGLSLSGVRFLWVARGDSSRLQEMVGGMGIVVPWCDQLRVLSHHSVGGFLTHCGWNSTLEAVYCGVPMLTFPIFWDQPIDSRLIVDEWKVGLSLKEEVCKEDLVGRDDIALVVKRLMDLDGTEGKEMRRRVAELRDFAHRAVSAGGSSSQNLDSVVKGLLQGNCI